MSLLPVGFGASGDDYEITDSLRFRSSASAYLSRTPASAGNRRTWTLSWWAKRGALGSTGFTVFSAGTGTSGDTGELVIKYDNNYPDSLAIQTTNTNVRFTNALYRDSSAWHHVVVAFDTTQATASNRTKVYVNGAQITSFNISNDLTQNTDTAVNNNVTQEIGVFARINSQYFDGYLTEVQMIDGQQLDADDFGEYDTNGTWKAKEYTGTYGTNGFYLPMKPTTQADGFNTVLYTGTGASQSIDGVGFSPDFVWIKNRSNAASPILVDSVRGIGEELSSNSSGAETSNGTSRLTSFDSDGFTISSTAVSSLNTSGNTYVAWAWDAGSGSAASNTNGSITSTVKANDTYGFSIASYVGTGANATIGHGLSAAPDLAIFKNRDDQYDDWWTYNSISGATKFLRLNTTAAIGTSSVTFNDTEPTSTVFSIGTGSAINTNGDNHIAYFFRSVAGYSKIGSFQNNNSTSGVTVTTGFRPGFIILKCTDAGERWFILDNARQVNNVSPPSTAWLVPNDSTAEGANGATTATIDFLDTGFQIKTTNPATGEVSFGTRTYIYMAIADTADARFNFDASGNKNNFDANNINSSGESETTYDLMKDTPSLVDENAANFAVLNPLNDPRTYVTYSDGNLTAINTSAALHSPFIGTIGMAPNSGKYYWEVIGTGDANTRNAMGIGTAASMSTTTVWGFVAGQAGLFIGGSASVYFYDESGTSTFNVAWASGNVVMHCYDANTGKFWIGQNGVWYNSSGGTTGDPATGANPTATLDNTDTWFPGGTVFNQGANSYLYYNFGQRPFAYTPPTGFLKLNTFNLPDSTIEKGSDYFNTVLYSGNSSTQSITGVGFQPDLVWAKDRTNVVHHTWTDAVRGAPLDLFSSSTSLESNDTNGLTAFTADGYNLGSSTNHNVTGHTYVGWNWLAGNSTSTSTAGSVNSTVSVNTTAGFSIVGFTAPSGTGNFTAGHGLGVTPAMVIVKTRDSSAAPWYTWHNTFSNLTDDYMRLNANSAKQTQSSGWGAGMTSSVIGLRAGYTTVATEDHIAYVFAAVEGYSSFGSYTGNGSTDGTFVYTGFRPAWIMVKRYTAIGNWQMFDSSRDLYNPENGRLYANLADAESDQNSVDFVSNGFKLRDTSGDNNSSGQSYIYMAFAENPFKNALAR